MDRINNYKKLKNDIITWISDYIDANNIESLVIGVSGGIDSAVTSYLCAETGVDVYIVGLPINQIPSQENLSDLHLQELENKFPNVNLLKIELSDVFQLLKLTLDNHNIKNKDRYLLSLANTRSRLRMTTLYHVASMNSGIVVGTGNKVEDYGIGFYTKYGDGGIDIAPIADLYKTEVYNLGKYMGVNQKILEAPPTDGLWDDERTDENQIGTSYNSLEWIMEKGLNMPVDKLSMQQKKDLKIYQELNNQNQHKMQSVPTFLLNQ